MFPIRDHNPSLRTPFVTWALILANVGVYLTLLSAYGNEAKLYAIYDTYAMVPARISSGQGYPTLVSALFLHAGFWHLAGNMLFLWIFGDNLEDQMGHVVFLGFYLLAGVAANFVQIAAAPWSPIPTLGASGAIAGVMGGYLLLFPRARVDILLFLLIYVRVFSLPAFVTLGIWFGLQVFNGMGDSGENGGVAYWAHAGGFVAGLVMCLPLWLQRGGPAYWQATEGHPPHPAAPFRLEHTKIPAVRRR